MKKIFLLIGLLPSSLALAGGFDINNLWSAKYSAVGGAAASNVQGAQSIYFNPAGLSQSHSLELDFNLVSGFLTKSAPIQSDGTSPTQGANPKTMPYTYIPVGGFFTAHQINERLGLGTGVYVAGGNGGKFKDVNFAPTFPTIEPEIDSSIVLIEFALGAGYKLSPDFSIGGAWRPSFLRLDTKVAAPFDLNTDGSPDVLLAPELNKVTALILGGYRLGMQYHPQDSNWGLGVSMRSENEFTAKGKTSGSSQLAGDTTTSPINGGDVSARAKIPMQLGLGAHYDHSTRLRVMTQYDYIHSSRVKRLELSGDDLVVAGVGSLPVANFSNELGWMDQHFYRFGAQYQLNEIWTVRSGYVFSTQVTPDDRATALSTAPGSEQSFTIGGGREIKVFGTIIQMDLATEYVRAAGEGKNSKPGSLDGTYKQHAFGLFTAFSYRR